MDYIQQCFTQLAVESSVKQADAVKTTEAPPSVDKLLAEPEEPQPGPSRPSAFHDVKDILPETDDALIEVRFLFNLPIYH